MTPPQDSLSTEISAADSAVASADKKSTKRGVSVQFIISLAITVCVLAYLLWMPEPHRGLEHEAPEASHVEPVRVAGPNLIAIEPTSTLGKKIQISTLQSTKINTPILTVTGTVAASMRPGKNNAPPYWQFNTTEVLTAYSDWQKSIADITFAETQLSRIKELAKARVDSQKNVVDRLVKLVEAGTDTPKDLAAENTNLLQLQIQGQKETHEAETALRVANRAEAVFARQLQQSGLDPDLLKTGTADMDVIMADVPEGLVSQVRLGQGCEAKFFGMPGKVFAGKVTSIAPVLSKERRSLRVLFVLDDPQDLLRPGMFAEIGLGTDPRDALLMPADGVVHVGRSDYALVDAGDNVWRVADVEVGELRNGKVEILRGLNPSERVLGYGAILIKPFIIRVVESDAPTKVGGAVPRIAR